MPDWPVRHQPTSNHLGWRESHPWRALDAFIGPHRRYAGKISAGIESREDANCRRRVANSNGLSSRQGVVTRNGAGSQQGVATSNGPDHNLGVATRNGPERHLGFV